MKKYYRAYVDPRFVLGACIKGFPEDIPKEKISERIKHYRTRFGSRDYASSAAGRLSRIAVWARGSTLHIADTMEEAAAIAFRQKTLLPLDDCLHALQREIPSLTRSSLHRLYQRHGISQRPRVDEPARKKKSFKRYPIGYLHIDISVV